MLLDVSGDVFSSTHSLAHCISQDAKMSKGIAKVFVDKFPLLLRLKHNCLSIGTAVPIRDNGRFIYSLVTKPVFHSKPTLYAVQWALHSMRAHAELHGVRQISAPRLGSGLDGLDFDLEVRPILSYVFADSGVKFVIYSLNIPSTFDHNRYVILDGLS